MSHCNKIISALFAILLTTPIAARCENSHAHNEDHQEEASKGPHGGRLLVDGDFGLEITIFETGVPPIFKVFPYLKKQPITPSEVEVQAELKRFEKTEKIGFKPGSESLISEQVIEEPHSFEVIFTAQFKGISHSWKYDSFEGRTNISSEMIKESGIEIGVAGPGLISPEVRVYGRLLSNQDKVFHANPRFPGVIKETRVSLGNKVKAGDVIAVLESDQSLQRYEIRSLIDGVVIEKHATLGEHVNEGAELFVISDLSEVWADFQAYGSDADEITEGQEILIILPDSTEPVAGKVIYLSPIADEATQSKLIRAVMANPRGDLRPGIFVSGILRTKGEELPLVVTRDSIQKFRDWDVVFLADNQVFQAVPVRLGKQDSQFVQLLSGVNQGAKYVTKNSYLIKADIEKSGASHDH